VDSIVFSANNNEEIMVLPVIPNDIEVPQPQNNEEFITINNGVLQLIGDMGLRTLSISSIFPTHDYKWIKKGSSSDGWSYVNFFKKWRDKRVPIRIVMTSNSKTLLNMACTVDNFTPSEAKNGDIRYTLEIHEYRFMVM